MAANKLWDGKTMSGTIDSLYYGIYELKFEDCMQHDDGLSVYFNFIKNGKPVHSYYMFPPMFRYSSSICYFQNDYSRPRFIYGDPELIYLTQDEVRDTSQLLALYYSGKQLYPKFKKMLEDSIVYRKG